MSKSIFNSLGKNEVFSHMRLQAANLFSFLFNLLDELLVSTMMTDQRSPMRSLICNLYVKRHMVPFSDFYAIFMCRSVLKKVRFV